MWRNKTGSSYVHQSWIQILFKIWFAQSAIIISESGDCTAAIFTALYCMQRGLLIAMPSACLSVRPSHACIVTKRTKGPPTFLYRMKGKLIYFFGHQERLVGDAPLYLKFWVKQIQIQTDPGFKNGDFQSIFALIPPQALHLAEKV